jgi:hypothetical protein
MMMRRAFLSARCLSSGGTSPDLALLSFEGHQLMIENQHLKQQVIT